MYLNKNIYQGWNNDKASGVLILPGCQEVQSMVSDNFVANPLSQFHHGEGIFQKKMVAILWKRYWEKAADLEWSSLLVCCRKSLEPSTSVANFVSYICGLEKVRKLVVILLQRLLQRGNKFGEQEDLTVLGNGLR